MHILELLVVTVFMTPQVTMGSVLWNCARSTIFAQLNLDSLNLAADCGPGLTLQDLNTNWTIHVCILITSKWVNSLRNCQAYSSVELDSDHCILSICLVTSLRTSKGKPCKRPKFDWKRLQDAAVKKASAGTFKSFSGTQLI